MTNRLRGVLNASALEISRYSLERAQKLVEKCITVFICALLLYQTLPYRHIEWKKGDKKANNLTSFPISTNYLCLFAVALHYPKVAVLPSIKTSAHAISNGFLYLYCHELVFPACMQSNQFLFPPQQLFSSEADIL